jgi:hypothetical protein
MSRFLQIAIIGALLLASASAARAQTVVASSFDQMRLIARLGDTITITDSSGQRVTGRLADLSPSSLELLVDGQRRSLLEGDALTVRRHGHAELGTGAKIGLGIGASLGMLAGLAISNECRGCRGMVPAFALIYGGLGAGIGVGFAALTPTRSVIYDSAPRQ